MKLIGEDKGGNMRKRNKSGRKRRTQKVTEDTWGHRRSQEGTG